MPATRHQVFREKELAFLILAGLLYFFPVFFLDETLYFRDLYSHFLPQKKFFADTVRSGQLPLWNPFIQGGEPFLGNLNNIPLYPSNLLYLVLPLLTAFNWDIVLHVIACAAGAYLFARKLGVQPVAAMIAGFVFGFCGFNLSLTNNMNRLLGMPYIPLLFLSWHLFLLQRKKKWFCVSVVFGVLQLLAGAPDIPITTQLTLLAWTLVFPYEAMSRARKIKLWILLLTFIIGISSLQMFPFLEMLRESQRTVGIDYSSFASWSLHPKRLPELILPNFFGDPTSMDQADYWGFKLEEFNTPLILSVYVGAVALLLGIAGAFTRSEHSILSDRIRYFLFAVFAIALVLSLGKYLPFFEWLYTYFPPVRIFRYPQKFFTAGLMPLALLAGFGAQILCITGRPGRRALLVFWIATGLFFLTYAAFSSEWFAAKSVQFFFDAPLDQRIVNGVSKALLYTTIVTGAAALILLYRKVRIHASQAWLLAVLIAMDLMVSNSGVNPSAPSTIFTKAPPLVDLVRGSISGGRLYRYEQQRTVRLKAPTKEMYWWARWDLETLRLYIASFYGIPIIYHEDLASLAQLRILKLRDMAKGPIDWNERVRILSAGGVTLILTDEDIRHRSIQKIAAVHNPSDRLFYLYKNLAAPAPVTFVTQSVAAKSDQDALLLVLNPKFDARQNVVMINPKVSSQKHCSSATIRVSKQSLISSIVSVQNGCAGYLVFAEPYYPGWKAFVDGRKTGIVRANFAFSSIYIEPGQHTVKRVYRPMSVILGAILSLLFLFALWRFYSASSASLR